MLTVEDSPVAPETTDPRVPPRNGVVTRYLIDRWAEERPDKVFVKFDDNGEEWDYRSLREKIVQTALGLQNLGVAQGDHVLVWMPNCREQIRIFFALNYLGAVYVPINTAYKGKLLEHVIDVSDATLAVVESSLVERMEALEMAYNPNDCIEVRWGAPEGSAERATCKRAAPRSHRRKMKRYRPWFHERRRPPRGTR